MSEITDFLRRVAELSRACSIDLERPLTVRADLAGGAAMPSCFTGSEEDRPSVKALDDAIFDFLRVPRGQAES